MIFPQGSALVIGGTGGIGEEVCRELARNGSGIVLTYKSKAERAAALVEEFRKLGVPAESAQLDIGRADDVKAKIDALAARLRLHTVVVASGSNIPQLLIRDVPFAKWKEIIDADLNGFYAVVAATLPYLKRGGGGSYVHISSAGLHRWPERDVLSVAPKAAIEALIKGIAKEEGRHGIRANSVAIGVIETGIFKRLWADGTFDEKWAAAVHNNLCLKRFGQANEVAQAVIYLASSRAAYVTGQMISVDGGYGV
jgi:NAD(P)-dependent dehydrogenase (short-subunit alcohol dehydrogenase family)